MENKIKAIGIDGGYGYMKAVASQNKIIFQNVAARGIERTIERSIRDINPSRSNQLKELDVLVEAEGRKSQHYFFGDLAFDGLEPSYIWDKDKVNAERSRAAMLTAMALASKEQEICYYVMTGLPLTHLPKLKDEYETSLLGTSNITFLGGPLSGQKKTIHIEKVRPTAQGYGIFLNEILDMNGNPQNKTLIKGQVGVIDVGMHTVNLTFIRNGEPKDLGSDTMEIGMNHAHQAIRQHIIENDGYVTIEEVESIYPSGVFESLNDKTINFEQVKQASLEDLANSVTQTVTRLWNLSAMKKIIIGGGGGEAVFDLLPFPQKKLAANSQFSNAFGFYKGAVRMLKKKELQEGSHGQGQSAKFEAFNTETNEPRIIK